MMTATPPPPAGLDDDAKAVWTRAAATIEAASLPALARYCLLISVWNRCAADVGRVQSVHYATRVIDGVPAGVVEVPSLRTMRWLGPQLDALERRLFPRPSQPGLFGQA